ncbi:MAG: hypothetical protein RL339_496 [Pseudomonadota bacterium]
MLAARFLAKPLAVLLLLLCALPLSAQPVVQPKIVLQTLPITIDVAAWTADDRYLLTASGTTREFIIWDVEQRLAVDRLRLPAGGDNLGAEVLRLMRMSLAPDGRTATVSGVIGRKEEGGTQAGRVYTVDLATRRIAMAQAPAPPGQTVEAMGQWLLAIGVLTTNEPEPEMSMAQALATLPTLPGSRSGRYTLRRSQFGFELLERGQVVPFQYNFVNGLLDHAALAPDGRRVAFIREADDEDRTVVEIFDTLTARYGRPAVLKGDYETLVWLNDSEFFAFAEEAWYTDPDPADVAGAPPPLVVVDATTGTVTRTIAPRCFPVSLGDGLFVGAGLANCRSGVGKDRDLAVYDPNSNTWVPVGLKLQDGERINRVAAHQASGRFAFATQRADGTASIHAGDTRDGDLDLSHDLPAPYVITQMQFSRDGGQVYLGASGTTSAWDLPSNTIKDLEARAWLPSFFASDGRTLVFGGPMEDTLARADLATGKVLPPLDLDRAIGGGFLPNRPLFWATSVMGVLKLWDTRDWSPLLTTQFFEQGKFLAIAGDGRYDTNLGPDAAQFRWLVSDAPFQSLPPQTFMRDYFEPRLSQRLTDCTTARNCAAVMKPVTSIAGLNRALPQARIVSVKPGEKPGTVEVDFELREGVIGGRRSGVYNPRMFLNNRFVGHTPDEPYEVTDTLDQWRKVNRLPDPGEDGVYRYTFVEKIPTTGPDQLTFSVYAFNEDRVKGETASFTYTRPPMPRRTPRAFVLNIGIDDYHEARLQLNYAVADARLIADRLVQIPGYEMHHAMLTGPKGTSGTKGAVTREAIGLAFGILAGFPPGPDIAKLAELGFDASQLDNATPDDIVIISFSGHGWADQRGNFYLVPEDGKWLVGDPLPDTDSLFSAADLTMWMRAIKAGEIAFIIDACHSGASVDSGGFKAGPMGDPGLGQLAFDKGIRILAATQANDVALESANLSQGLLTAALGKGLTPQGGPADLNGDRKITLDEWLRYAVQELPRIAQGAGTARGFTITQRPGTAAAKPAVQEPALFDFTNAASPVVLRGQ